MVWVVIAIVIALAVFFLTAKQKQRPSADEDGPGAASDFPYLKQSSLFTPAERSFCGVLDQVSGNDFRVFGKVRVADVVAVLPGLTNSARAKAFNLISAKHFDFVLCSPGDLSVLCVIELNDASHQKKDRQDRDAFLERVCNAAKLPLITFDAKRAYSAAEVKEQIVEKLADVSLQSIAAVPAAASGPTCPKCSSPMVKRVSKGGETAGKEFWGCSNFPACRGIMNI